MHCRPDAQDVRVLSAGACRRQLSQAARVDGHLHRGRDDPCQVWARHM